MKKRGLAMLLALSMGVGMLSGCSIGSSGAGAGTEDGAGAESQTAQTPEGAAYAAGGYEGNQEELAEMLQHFGDHVLSTGKRTDRDCAGPGADSP